MVRADIDVALEPVRDDAGEVEHARHTSWRRLMMIGELVLIGLVAVIARSIDMTRQSLWLDEAYSVYLSAHRLPQILDFTISSDAHLPLYYILLHIWMTLFGPSELAIRGLSVLASVAATFLTYLIARVITSERAAVLAALFMGMSSFQVWYAQETRMYALVTCATLIGLYGLVRALTGNHPRSWLIFAGGMLAAVYLDYSAWYVLLGVAVWFWFSGRQRKGVSAPFLLSIGTILVGALLWAPSFVQQLRAVGGLTAWISSASGSGLLSVLTDFYFNRSNLSQPPDSLVAILATGFSLTMTALALWAPRRSASYTLLACWLCCPLGLGLVSEFLGHPITISRTMMVAQPALLILLAMAVDLSLARLPAGRERFVGAGLLSVALVILLWGNVAAQVTAATTTVKEDWRGAAALIAEQQQPDDLILFNAYFAQMPFDYYYQQRSQSVTETVHERGYLLQEALVYSNLNPTGTAISNAKQLGSYGRVWLIKSHASQSGAPPLFGQRFRLVSEHQFAGVTVYLYVKTA